MRQQNFLSKIFHFILCIAKKLMHTAWQSLKSHGISLLDKSEIFLQVSLSECLLCPKQRLRQPKPVVNGQIGRKTTDPGLIGTIIA